MTAAAAPTYELVTADGAFADGGEYLIAIKSGVADEYWFLIPGTTGANPPAMNELYRSRRQHRIDRQHEVYLDGRSQRHGLFAPAKTRRHLHHLQIGSGTNLVTKAGA